MNAKLVLLIIIYGGSVFLKCVCKVAVADPGLKSSDFYGMFDIPESKEIGSRLVDLNGITITATADNDAYYTHDIRTSNISGIYKFEGGTRVNIYRDLKSMLNFSESALPGSYINVYPNGTGYGLTLKHFNAGRADISISNHIYRPSMAKHVTILHPTTLQGVAAFCKNPSFRIGSDMYWTTFDPFVWLSILATLFILILSFLIMLWFTKLVYGNTNPSDADWILGCYRTPSIYGMRILVMTLYLATLVVSCAFSAKLASLLTVRHSDVHSFQDLLDKDYKFIISATSSSLGQYAKGLKSYYRNRLNGEVSTVGHHHLISTILTESKTALLTYHTDFQRYFNWHAPNAEGLACSTIVNYGVDIGFTPRAGFIVPKGSKYKEIFNQKLLTLMEIGLMHRYNKISEKYSLLQCPGKSTAIFHKEPLELKEVGQVALVFLGGLILSNFVLIVEYFIFSNCA